jgi:hypothetical protein
MHHEPLFKRGNLKKDLQNIIKVCGWADSSAAEWIEHISTLDELLKNAPHGRNLAMEEAERKGPAASEP